MLTPLTLVASILANLLPAAPIYALQTDDKVQLKGKTTWTAVSGETGSENEILGRTANFHAAYSIAWWEDSDDPCKFELITRHMNLGGLDGPDAQWCKNGTPGNSKGVARFGDDEYITAIQICRTDKSDPTADKIKGLRVWGRVVDDRTGTLGSEAGPDEDKHTHCKVWENKVSCPAGQVASRIKVYYKNYRLAGGFISDYGYASGISLGCRKVVPKETNEGGGFGSIVDSVEASPSVFQNAPISN